MSTSALAAILLVGVGACTTALPPEKTTAIGPAFNEEVKQGYVRLASAELSAFGFGEGRHFRRKAEAAMLGDTVWPDKVGSREVPPEVRDEALALRERLVAALEGTARERLPAEAALAQVNFDCWLAEIEGGGGDGDAALCREAFVAALGEIEAVAVEVPDAYEVFFESGRTVLDTADLQVIDEAARAAGLVDPERIDVIGYADPTGSPDFNRELSQDRAEAVATALTQAGAPPDVINVRAGGATGAPGSSESRRVDIVIVR